MTRALSITDYGNYGQTMLVIAFLVALLTFGLPQIIYVYLSQSNDKKQVLTSNLAGTVILGLIGTLAVYFSSAQISQWFENPELESLIKLFSFSIILVLPFQSINSYLIFINKVKTSSAISIVFNFIKISLVVMSIQYFDSVYLAIASILISQTLQLVTGLIIIRHSIDLNFNIKKNTLFTQIKKGFPLGLTGLLGTGILYIDGLMVSKMEGIESYAIYRNGAFEIPFLSAIYGSIAAIILPEIAKLFNQNKTVKIAELKKKVITSTMMITYPALIFFLFNSNDIIPLYLGEKYNDSAVIFTIFNLALLIRVNDYHDILIAANKSKYILLYYTIVFILNCVLNYFLISWFGKIGAAISTIISLFLFAFLHLQKSLSIIKMKYQDFFNFKQIFYLFIICITISSTLYFSLSVINQIEVRLLLNAILFFPLTYFLLIKFDFISKSLIQKLIPKKFRK
jgi:O-antigen/teichoic acid export membrane protein